ncbi:alpha/beta hydrolase-fold protein [Aquimarina rhabdastrellae]
MKTTKIILLIYAISLNVVFAQEFIKNNDAHTLPKSYLKFPHTEVIPIKETKTNRQYELYVELPEGYTKNKDKQYPVIYYTDALWHVELLSGAAEYIMEDAILVGISWQKDIKEEFKKEGKFHMSRFRDYSITKSNNPKRQAKYQFGQANNHLDFIRKDVIKFIEKHYRADPDNRTYFGYSLGGVFGAYTLMTQPNTFKNYILGSPALDGDIPVLSTLESNTKMNANVFISYGSEEEKLSKYAEEFITLLKNKKDNSLSFEKLVIEGTHQTAFPMTGVRGMQWLAELQPLFLGQKPPGLTPKIFAPGIISIDDHVSGSITFSPDMDELFFNRRKSDESHNLYTMKLINGEWSVPAPAFFSTNKEYLDFHSRFSPEGNRLYFGSTRPINDTIKTSNPKRRLHQWYIEKDEKGSWSEPILMKTPFLDRYIMCTTPSKNGNLYFTSGKGPGAQDEGIYYAINQNGHYTSVKRMGNVINANGKWIAHPYIAPDESYILYDSEKESEPDNGDIFISFNIDGTWTKSYSLGPKINTRLSESTATVSPDGKYLFFARGEKKLRENGSTYWESKTYWVDFIKLKKEILESINHNK